MTEKDTLIIKIQHTILSILEERRIDKKNICVYLFGSAKYKKNYRDIDILITYQNINYENILFIRRMMYERLVNEFNKDIDIVLLNEKEAYSSKFIIDEKCELIF